MSAEDAWRFAQLSREQFGSLPGTYWHGTPYGGATDKPGLTGVHVGTRHAAREALNARIGHRADGEDWSGSSEYGKTLLAGKESLRRLGRHASGYSAGERDAPLPDEDHYPRPYSEMQAARRQTAAGGYAAPITARPTMYPVRIVGPMSNSPQRPHEDFKANGYMAGQIKRGTAKRGYFYTNIGEDTGSISATVPSHAHLKTHEDYVREAMPFHVGQGGVVFHDRRLGP